MPSQHDPLPATDPAPENPGNPAYLSETWCDLDWSPWVPFNAPREYWYIPKEPGVYRIRPAGKDFLMFIGETGQSLHKKLAELRQALRRADLMPWSDPHTEAPALWCWWKEWLQDQEDERKLQGSLNSDRSSDLEDEKNMQRTPSSDRSSDLEDEKNMKCSSSSNRASSADRESPVALSSASATENEPDSVDDENAAPVMLECSAAPLDASAAGRKGMTAFLLYTYRQERGESPLCNFGRFHPRYRRSSNRNEKRRGGKLEDGQMDNPAGSPSFGPLEGTGSPGSSDWMAFAWPAWAALGEEQVQTVDKGAGLYLLADAATLEIVYIGHSDELQKRLSDHSRKSWDGRELVFSFQTVGTHVRPHNLRELENDLIGNYYEQYRKAPALRFRNPTGR